MEKKIFQTRNLRKWMTNQTANRVQIANKSTRKITKKNERINFFLHKFTMVKTSQLSQTID